MGEQRGTIARGLEGGSPRQRGALSKRVRKDLRGRWASAGGHRARGRGLVEEAGLCSTGLGAVRQAASQQPSSRAPGWFSPYSVRLLISGS